MTKVKFYHSNDTVDNFPTLFLVVEEQNKMAPIPCLQEEAVRVVEDIVDTNDLMWCYTDLDYSRITNKNLILETTLDGQVEDF